MIRKVEEPTDWVSSFIVFEKPNGKLRVCIDPTYIPESSPEEITLPFTCDRRRTSGISRGQSLQ